MRSDDLKSRAKRGRMRPVYDSLLTVLGPVAELVYSLAYRAWPSLSRRALSRSLPIEALKNIVDQKVQTDRTFLLHGMELEYYFHSHNNFRMTERAIEIPIIRQALEDHPHHDILEIGNVSNYYYDAFRSFPEMARRTVVDRCEEGHGVLNTDIADFNPGSRFDFIFSISTFEHMDSDRGWNPGHRPGTSELISVAADNIRHVVAELLEDGGVLVLTAPIGYSEEWDRTFFSGQLRELPDVKLKCYGFRKVDELRWEQRPPEEGAEAKQTAPAFPEMNFIVVCEFQKETPGAGLGPH